MVGVREVCTRAMSEETGDGGGGGGGSSDGRFPVERAQRPGCSGGRRWFVRNRRRVRRTVAARSVDGHAFAGRDDHRSGRHGRRRFPVIDHVQRPLLMLFLLLPIAAAFVDRDESLLLLLLLLFSWPTRFTWTQRTGLWKMKRSRQRH